jgi:hypothetical protein
VKFCGLVVLSLGLSGSITAACDDSTGTVRLVSQASFIEASGRFSPNPIPFSQTVSFGCSNGGFVFAPSFLLVVTAGTRDLTLDHATIHMIDGTNLGGPSVTIPHSEFAARTPSVFIRAGSSRDFSVNARFGCATTRPRALAGNVFLIDSRGTTVTLPVDSQVR